MYIYTWFFNIAMENPRSKWRFLAGKIIYFYGPFSMAMLNNQRVYNIYIYPPTPALAKAGAAPGTTAGVELVFLSNRHPKATSMASYGRPSLPCARP